LPVEADLVIDVLFRAYQDAIKDFQNASQSVLNTLAAEGVPSGDQLAAEEEARAAVLAVRSLLISELEREEIAVRSHWPLIDIETSAVVPHRPSEN
jgi:hypothetical protein